MFVRAFAVLCSFLLLWRCVFGWPTLPSYSVLHLSLEHELDGSDQLPNDPTALVVSDVSGQPKWSVAIPHNASFPLRGNQYREICLQSEELSIKLSSESRSLRSMHWRRKGLYYAQDRTFLDVADAEQSGALPQPEQAAPEDVCSMSLTFAMDTDDASFGKTLLMLWLSYGLAKKEGRAFFIDDTRWPYGKYTSYFPSPPSPGCSPPPPHRVVPCPHQARHLLVSAVTARWTFGMAFEKEFTELRKQGLEKHRQIYDLVRLGYEDLFKLVGDDASYAQSRIAGTREDATSHGGSVVGIQIRRGDLHPSEYQFSRDYLPLERYSAAARSLFREMLDGSQAKHENSDLDDFSAVLEYVNSPLLLASDDPDIFASPELSQAAAPFAIQKAQERITLATKATLDQSSPVQPIREPGSAYVKHVDENSGWEGGFYSALFYSLGNPISASSSGTIEHVSSLSGLHTDKGTAVSEQAMRIRELVGRAYLLDLAVLGQSDGTVCAVSSAACRILGVMLGWDAVMEGRWVNVDDGRAWSWDGSR